jgi:hypothetical protein
MVGFRFQEDPSEYNDLKDTHADLFHNMTAR